MPPSRAHKAVKHPLVLTSKDEAILAALGVYNFLTALDVAHLGLYAPSSLTHVRERLSALAGNKDHQTEGYPLYRIGMPSTKGNSERIYALSAAGRKIVENLGHPVSWRIRPAKLRV